MNGLRGWEWGWEEALHQKNVCLILERELLHDFVMLGEMY